MTDDEIIKKDWEDHKCDGDFGEAQWYAWKNMSKRGRAMVEEGFTPEDRINMHKYLVTRMTAEQQDFVDDLLYLQSQYLIHTGLPLSKKNQTGSLLKNNPVGVSINIIESAKKCLERSKVFHPIFDYKADRNNEKSWWTDYSLNMFDPYQEYEYISDIKMIIGEIKRKCDAAGVSRVRDLENKDFSPLIQNINIVRGLWGEIWNRYFFNFSFALLFGRSEEYLECLYPSTIKGTVFNNCLFPKQVFTDVIFENCIFIDCHFTDCVMENTRFIYCEFYNSIASSLKVSTDERILFSNCYFHKRLENGMRIHDGKEVFSGSVGVSNLPWNKTFIESFDSNDERNSISKKVVFSGCVGVPTNADFLNTLDRDSKGFLCYKRIGRTSYPRPERWVIKNGSFITENMNNDVLEMCERGVNVSNFFFAFTNYTNSPLWLCRIRYEDAGDICIPWDSEGKFRATRVELLHIIPNRFELLKICQREVEKYNKMRLILDTEEDIKERYRRTCEELTQDHAQKMYGVNKILRWWYVDYNAKIAKEEAGE